MNFPARRTPFALLTRYVVAGALVGAFAAPGLAASLRVDPALLDRPTLEPSAAAPSRLAASATANEAVRVASEPTVRPTVAEKSWFERLRDPVVDAYDEGTWEFYLPLRTHHLRSKYSAEKIARYQESPLGFGVGRGLYNEHGNWEGVYAMAFQDSHSKPMYSVGYSWKAIWRPAEDVRLGLGYTAGLMSRVDIFSYVPFPIILPVASIAYKNLNLETSYVPGGQGNGNIFFIWAKWELGKRSDQPGV